MVIREIVQVDVNVDLWCPLSDGADDFRWINAVCHYREPRPERFDRIDKFAAAVTELAADWGDARHLHLDRPRGQLVGPRARATLAETPLPY